MKADITWHRANPLISSKYTLIYETKFPELFNKSLRRTEELSKTTHQIDTGEHSPIKLPPRRYSPSQQEAIRDFCKAHQGTLIRKSKGPWAAPLLLTPKKTPSQSNKIIWRICVDYRELNKITK
ncbi:putative krab-a domain-containing protein [Erysiphe necator]|uniref:Putative krab-a domain-containing protein n=1 Tax=Uncinula necator TaxID=52586 RepID=A0A0B1NWA1_UNCNE|nr:putative krab-a domain-containing protein [Erysiphe necator]